MARKRRRKPISRSTRRWLIPAGILVAVLLAAGGGYLVGRSGGHGPAQRARPAVAVAPVRPPLPSAPPATASSQPPLPAAPPATGQGHQAPAYPELDRQKLDDLARQLQEDDRQAPELASLPPASNPLPSNLLPSNPLPTPPHPGAAPAAKPPAAHVAPSRKPSLALAPGERPMIAMVIDDVGVDKGRSRRAIDLPGPLTLSFLPYARDLEGQIAEARAHGHAAMLHMPMQPLGRADPGPNALTVGLGPDEVRRRLDWALSRVGPVQGLNNHMGSRFTENEAGMAVVMSDLHERGLFFLDSMTSGKSIGIAAARRAGVPVVSRDVFLDNTVTRDAAAKALAQVEAIARRHGYAIAIGHPHDQTMDVLGPWLRTIEGKGLRLVKLDELVRRLNTAPPPETVPVSAAVRQQG